jgi:hypothetical protein
MSKDRLCACVFLVVGFVVFALMIPGLNFALRTCRFGCPMDQQSNDRRGIADNVVVRLQQLDKL